MDSKKSNFQTILFVVLGVGLAIALMIFGGVIKTPQRGASIQIQASGSVSMWGPFVSTTISERINTFNNENENIQLSYVGKNIQNYDIELLEAFASGNAPDIIILPHNLISRYRDKVIILNEITLPERNFKDLYSQGAEIFRTPEGTVGLPLGVDPLVMYYNRDLLDSGGVVQPPQFWNEDFLTFVQAVTQVDSDGLDVNVAATALGETSNIKHSTEILSALFMQLGNPITFFNQSSLPESSIKDASTVSNAPGSTALEYFTQFVDSSDDLYSWNKALPEARDAFAAEKLAVYFGFASELLDIQRKNPNLNFDVAPLPQIKELNKKLTYGNFYALAIPKTSINASSALSVAGALTTGAYNVDLLGAFSLQPVRRDLLAVNPPNPYQKIFYNSALIARGWYNPNPVTVDTLFESMVNGVNSGQFTPSRAITELNQKINEAFQ
jgi:ABC-type glycerol-3-phosphate transport system substrate-binding protein